MATSTASATSTAAIQGFAIRRNNSCLSDEVGCGPTWETWHACCPSGSFCPGSKISIPNNVCCPSWTDCTANIEDPPVCAESSWGLYNYTGYFCCPSSQEGFMVKGTDWVGCSGADSPGNASYSAVKEISTGSATASVTSSTSTSGVSSTITSAATATGTSSSSSSSHTNTGAIAGGVVGGVVGAAAIGALLFFFLRRPKKMQTAAPPVSQPPYSEYSHITGTSEMSELNGQSRPAELMSSTDQPRYELPGSH
ncbi:hypothetical protein BO71DRAFT_397790 [Aspergillus ellipticus CBS 707.79]|uniref:Uncharacterized protein n=1 Tax=Aspergillus ellipticus CBS 707.79 TaxID=1448320 RepID=A0A319E500_9EURO|nr:hypothetical protein BO71DRAFT_397790 [Aspergillus ellipticus CBS 707.79]